MNAPLALTVTGDRSAYPRGAPIPVTVTLRNTSSEALWVNARLGVGYQDGIVRELYFTVYTADGRVLAVPDEARTDAHRMPPVKEDFRSLAPGQSLAAVVDLTLWFPFSPGRHFVVFSYENTWDGSQFGIEAWTGTVSSGPLTVIIE